MMMQETWSRRFGPGRWREQWRGALARCHRQGCGRRAGWWRAFGAETGGLRLRDAWYCTLQCFELALTDTILRLRRPMAAAPPSPSHRVPLGLVLLSRGQLSNQQLRAALEAQRVAGRGRIGDWLQQLGFASEQQVTSALGLQWACPVFPLQPTFDPACGQMIPLPLLRACRMLPVHYAPSTGVLLMAFCERIDYTVLYLLERMLHCRTEPCLAGASALQRILAGLEQQTRCDEIVFERVSDACEMARITRSYVQKLSAETLQLAAVGEHIWVQLGCRGGATSLVFGTPELAQAQANFLAQDWPGAAVKVGRRFADESLGGK